MTKKKMKMKKSLKSHMKPNLKKKNQKLKKKVILFKLIDLEKPKVQKQTLSKKAQKQKEIEELD